MWTFKDIRQPVNQPHWALLFLDVLIVESINVDLIQGELIYENDVEY